MKKLLSTLLVAILAIGTFAFTACGDTDKPPAHEHVWAEVWAKDETHHWHECTAAGCTVTENSEKDGYAAHDFSNGSCVCGEVKIHNHVWAKAWTKNATHHWHECRATGCTITENSEKDGYAAHNLSNGNCVCGEKNPHSHAWAQTWTKSETHHWHECTADGCYVTENSKKNGYVAHNTAGEGGTCSVCGMLPPTKGLAYSLNADGESYCCTGIGTVKDESDIIIAEAYDGKPVTSIDKSAFQSRTSIRYVTIPNSITDIGSQAFDYCTSLRSITIPEGVTQIKSYTFESCTSLRSVTIPSGVTSIGRQAFYNCTALTAVSIPASVSTIGYAAFEDCFALANVTLKEGVKTISQNAFRACKKITSISIPKSVTEIGSSAFYNCAALTSVTIPSGVTKISDWLFRECTSLTSVVIENGATEIGEWAFAYCESLAKITIPVSITTIKKHAFQSCRELKEITYDGGTITQWREEMDRQSYWNSGIIKYTLHCTDGDLTLT